MLEPVLKPRTGRAFWLLVALLGLVATLSDTGVATRNGFYPFSLLGPAIAAVAGIRAIGITVGLRHGGPMPFVLRAASWLAVAIPLAMVGVLGDAVALSVLGLLFALDALGGLLAPKEDAKPAERAWVEALRARTKPALVAGLAIVSIVLFHVFWASRVEGGELLDWAFVSLLFGAMLRYTMLPAGRGDEERAFAPGEARRHARTERALPNPLREGVAEAVATFRRRGDVEALLRLVDGFGVDGLADEARRLLARPGTTREADLQAVAELLEARLSEQPLAKRAGTV